MIDRDEEQERQEQQKKNNENARKAVLKAYEVFFQSPEGQTIWADLCVQYKTEESVGITSSDGRVDVNATLIHVGQQNVLKYIMAQSIEHDYSNSIKQRQEQLNVRRKSDNIHE